jgi:hypothetical protein
MFGVDKAAGALATTSGSRWLGRVRLANAAEVVAAIRAAVSILVNLWDIPHADTTGIGKAAGVTADWLVLDADTTDLVPTLRAGDQVRHADSRRARSRATIRVRTRAALVRYLG